MNESRALLGDSCEEIRIRGHSPPSINRKDGMCRSETLRPFFLQVLRPPPIPKQATTCTSVSLQSRYPVLLPTART
jgi:hypothetical protein